MNEIQPYNLFSKEMAEQNPSSMFDTFIACLFEQGRAGAFRLIAINDSVFMQKLPPLGIEGRFIW
jgi:hypothetical protein